MIAEKTNFQLFIVNKIKKIRQEHNISQAELSDIIGLNSIGQVGNIESPKFKHKYTLEHIYRISTHFNYPIEKFFLTDDELEKSNAEIIEKLILKLIEYQK